MITNKDIRHNGHKIYAIHTPGDNEKQLKEIDRYFTDKPLKVDSSVTLITTLTKDLEPFSPIKKQTDFNNIPLKIAAENHDGDWQSALKIFYLAKMLEEVKTPYVFLVDGKDVMLTNNIDKDFIEEFQCLGCDALFNGTPKPFPNYSEPIDWVIHRRGNHNFFNAGVVFGYTSFLKELYSLGLERMSEKGFANSTSEQFILGDILVSQFAGRYKVDSSSDFFVVLHHDDNAIINRTDSKGTEYKEIVYKW